MTNLKRILTGSVATAALVGLIGLAPAPALSQDIGVLAAVNRDVLGARPTEPPRQLILREKLILDERITTSNIGGGQVMFLDQTTLTLSPNSDVLLDRYVYDPSAQTGDVSITLLKGAMRFVGGRITKTGVATIRTPTATIGIRGGIGHVSVGGDGGTQYLHIAGTSSTVENASGSVVVTREGGAVSVSPSNEDGPVGGDQNDGALQPVDGQAAASDAAGSTASDTGQSVAGSTGATQPGATTTGATQARQPDQPAGEEEDQPTEQARDVDDPSIGRDGGEPVYVGVATPEMIEIALGSDGGVGDGGLATPLSNGVVRRGVEQIEAKISGVQGAVQNPPISTKGEQQEVAFDAPPPDLGEPPQDDFADDNLAEDLAEEIPQILDGLQFEGQWNAVAGLANGDFVAADGPLAFQMQYSLTDAQGVVLVELPDTGDIAAPNVTLLNGDQVRGDEFIINGDEDLTLSGDASVTSRLGGDASEALITIDTARVARGEIFLDYSDSQLDNTDFVDGDILPTTGEEVVGSPISTTVDQLREEFGQ